MTSTPSPIILTTWPAYISTQELLNRINEWMHLASEAGVVPWISTQYTNLCELHQVGSLPEVAAVGLDGMPVLLKDSFASEITRKMFQTARTNFVLLGTAQQQQVHPINTDRLQEQIRYALDAELKVVLSFAPHGLQTEEAGHILSPLSAAELKNVYLSFQGGWGRYFQSGNWSEQAAETSADWLSQINSQLVDGEILSTQLLLELPHHVEDWGPIFQSTKQVCGGFVFTQMTLHPEILQQVLPFLEKAPALSTSDNDEFDSEPIVDEDSEEEANEEQESSDEAFPLDPPEMT